MKKTKNLEQITKKPRNLKSFTFVVIKLRIDTEIYHKDFFLLITKTFFY